MTLVQQLNYLLKGTRLRISKLSRGSSVAGFDWVEDASALLSKKPIKTVLDVGANRSQTSKRLARKFPEASIHCFEPTPASFSILTDKMRVFPNASTYQLAMGSNNGTTSMFFRKQHESNSILPPDPDMATIFEEEGKHEVTLARIDTWCKDHNIDHVDILKINAEGYDLEILKGSEQFLKEANITIIFTEVIFQKLFQGQPAFEETLHYLAGFGYKFVGFYESARDSNGGMLWSNALFINPSRYL